jgi:prefoldin subunit 5
MLHRSTPCCIAAHHVASQHTMLQSQHTMLQSQHTMLQSQHHTYQRQALWLDALQAASWSC